MKYTYLTILAKILSSIRTILDIKAYLLSNYKGIK